MSPDGGARGAERSESNSISVFQSNNHVILPIYISDLFIYRQNILTVHLNDAVSSLLMDAISIGIPEEVVL